MRIFSFVSFLQQSTLDRKKKNFTFSRKFPFMKSKDDKNEDGSDQERKYFLQFKALLAHRKIASVLSYFFFFHLNTFAPCFNQNYLFALNKSFALNFIQFLWINSGLPSVKETSSISSR